MHACRRRICLWPLFPGVSCAYSLVQVAPKSKGFLYVLACFISLTPLLVLVGLVGPQEQVHLSLYVWCLASCVHPAPSCSFRPLVS